MTALVTGASGFLGRRVAELLRERGETVRLHLRASSRLTSAALEDCAVVRCALDDRDALIRGMQGVRTVYNCAGHASDWGAWAAFRAANLDGLANLLEAALRTGSVERFVHVSTTDIYGYPDIPCAEGYGFHDVGLPYNRSKGLGDDLALDFHRRTGLPVVVVRPATIFGPRSKDWVVELGRLLVAGYALTIDRGASPAGLVYVDDVADAMIRLAGTPSAAGQAYNIVDPEIVSWRDYFDAVADALGVARARLDLGHATAMMLARICEAIYRVLGASSRPLFTRHAVLLLSRSQQYDTRKLTATIPSFPAVGVAQGLVRTASWLRTVDEFQTRR